MSVRNLTWQQVIVCVALLGAIVVAYRVLGELPAGVLVVITAIVNLLLGRDPRPRAPKRPSSVNGGAS